MAQAIGAVIGRKNVMEAAQRTFISSTYWTERIGPAAALAVIKKMQSEAVCEWVDQLGNFVQDIWTKHSQSHELNITVGGISPLSHFEFSDDSTGEAKAYFIQLMLDQAILSGTRFYPMYAHTEKHVSDYRQAVDAAFSAVADGIVAGNIADKLEGQPASSGFARIA